MHINLYTSGRPFLTEAERKWLSVYLEIHKPRWMSVPARVCRATIHPRGPTTASVRRFSGASR